MQLRVEDSMLVELVLLTFCSVLFVICNNDSETLKFRDLRLGFLGALLG